jgi:hypothetical protein
VEKNQNSGGVRNLQDIKILSDLVDQHSCGNCGELASRAFMFLFDLGIRPLEYMSLIPGSAELDHAFVVIGRQEGPDDDNFGRNWVKGAAICDPWASGLYRALPPGQPGPRAQDMFGESYAAYAANLLEQNMKAMHGAGFSGVDPQFRAG